MEEVTKSDSSQGPGLSSDVSKVTPWLSQNDSKPPGQGGIFCLHYII